LEETNSPTCKITGGTGQLYIFLFVYGKEGTEGGEEGEEGEEGKQGKEGKEREAS
jgi:hypothetical protein